jgi:hypothetical protein
MGFNRAIHRAGRMTAMGPGCVKTLMPWLIVGYGVAQASSLGGFAFERPPDAELAFYIGV